MVDIMAKNFDLDKPAMMIYGYEATDAAIIAATAIKLLTTEVQVVNATFSESETIREIIEGTQLESYQDELNKMVMFLGITPKQIKKIIENWPKDIEEPMFCGLTETNIDWTLDYLLESLALEKNAMLSREEQQG